MQYYSIIQYEFNDYPSANHGIGYVNSFTLTTSTFHDFLQSFNIHLVSFDQTGEHIHHALTNIDKFFNGLYKDVDNIKHYMICLIW